MLVLAPFLFFFIDDSALSLKEYAVPHHGSFLYIKMRELHPSIKL
jgi:hypothetical protein